MIQFVRTEVGNAIKLKAYKQNEPHDIILEYEGKEYPTCITITHHVLMVYVAIVIKVDNKEFTYNFRFRKSFFV